MVHAALRLQPMSLGVMAGIAVGGAMAAPNLREELASHPSGRVLGRPAHQYRAISGFTANLVLPALLTIGGIQTAAGAAGGASALGSGLLGAAVGVPMAWWGLMSLGDLRNAPGSAPQ